MSENPRKGKAVYNLWLTEDEERLLLEALNGGLWSSAFLIIKAAKERGDFERR